MCGIAGIIGSSKIENFALKMQLACDSLKHRGPDNENYYINTFQNVALAHTRLSIIDLSKKANQPFKYLHYITVYNGEIYNFLEIKKILLQKGYQFTTQNDTEVLVAAFDCWGNECVQYFDGMFAFVIYNTNNQTIFAARDAFGEKPFYYSLQNNGSIVPTSNFTENSNSNFNAWNLDLSYSWWFAPGSQISILYRNNAAIFENEFKRDLGTNIRNVIDKDALNHVFSVSVRYFIDYNSLKK